MGSASAFSDLVAPDWVRSAHGDRQTPAAGSESPASRRATSVASVRPPPAESPAMTTRAGSAPPATTQRYAARSEEHTSELQSLMRISYADFCLKKKTQTPRA